MASYKDYLSGKVKITSENISKAVSTIASAFNKRLRRIEESGNVYQGEESEPYYGSDAIAGVKKFGAKGKTTEELYAEYKRMKDFSRSEVSSISGMKRFATDVGIELDRIREYRRLEGKNKHKKSTFEYVEYDVPEDSERSEYEAESDTEVEFDFYGMFRGQHLYNYMRRNYGINISSKYDSNSALQAAEAITAQWWGVLTMDEMAAQLHDDVMEMGIETTKRRHRNRR